MKFSIIACLIFLFIGFNSFADCSSSGLSVYPSQKEVKKDNLFIVEGYAHSQKVITGLNTEFPVYLECGNERIALLVLETHAGQFSLNQAILKPEKPLTPGKEYVFVIDKLFDQPLPGKYNPKTRKLDPISYVVKDESDTEAPKWIKTPIEKNKSLIHLGCGPLIYVHFELAVKESSDFLIKTTFKSLETGKETIYYLMNEGREGLSIGHDMCSGEFNFNEGTKYQAKFQLMDLSGNVSEETEWVAFTKPVD